MSRGSWKRGVGPDRRRRVSEEKYVTLTEALEWEKRVRAPTTEDERVTALENALHAVNEAAAGWDGLEYESNMGRALLDAVRLIRAHEFVEDGDWIDPRCPLCSRPEYQGHLETCEVGRWVRAAERAGI